MNQHYNIMTSSDEGLLNQIEVLIYSLCDSLRDDNIDFFFFHRKMDVEKLNALRRLSDKLSNITFNEVVLDETDVNTFDLIAQRGGGWAGEAYYSLMAHKYLPEEIDRILYLDAGDIMVVGDISEFYNSDFEDNVIITSNIRLYDSNGKPVIFSCEEDLSYPENISKILASTFNSGAYMLNVDKMRCSGIVVEDYLATADYFAELSQKSENVYFGDQGFLSACFLGDIKYWGYPDCNMLMFTPYNFQMGWYNFFSIEPPFKPSIIHFVGGIKPYLVDFGEPLPDYERYKKEKQINDIIPGQRIWYEMWYKYAFACQEMLDNSCERFEFNQENINAGWLLGTPKELVEVCKLYIQYKRNPLEFNTDKKLKPDLFDNISICNMLTYSMGSIMATGDKALFDILCSGELSDELKLINNPSNLYGIWIDMAVFYLCRDEKHLDIYRHIIEVLKR